MQKMIMFTLQNRWLGGIHVVYSLNRWSPNAGIIGSSPTQGVPAALNFVHLSVLMSK